MKLAIDPENVTYEGVDGLASDGLVKEIADILNLDKTSYNELRSTIQHAYHEFLSGYYDVKNSVPEHEQTASLTEVADIAYSLIKALNKLIYIGDTDQRLAKRLENHDIEGVWKTLRNKSDKTNPNLNLRRNIASLHSAAQSAADAPNKLKEKIKTLRAELKQEQNPDKKHKLEGSLALLEWREDMHPNNERERKVRAKERRIPKDLPIRNSINILKNFFDEYVGHPFTAGKYYSEIGFKSSAFYAVKTVLKKIYPEVSDRKIASIMQEVASGNGYNFPSENEGKTCSTD